jgi:TAP-like protein
MIDGAKWLEWESLGRLVPLLIGVLGMKRFATLVISQGLKQVSKERADWVVGLIADQDRNLMVTAWKQAMAFDSRRHLVEIKCPTLIVAASNDQAVPIHHAKMLHDGIAGSQLIIIDGADHALIWTRSDELVRVIDEFLGARWGMFRQLSDWVLDNWPGDYAPAKSSQQNQPPTAAEKCRLSTLHGTEPGPLMDGPAVLLPYQRDAGIGRLSNGAPPCPTNQIRPLPQWASILARTRSPQREGEYIDARPHSHQIDKNLLRRTAGPYIRANMRRSDQAICL